ncbi:unnamed protein product [Owenia fusiformis]|uniref:Uncharacterized protein n=1 Tax=Owenia fusiformis TaxID=6347 RepID=A0A8J1UFV2_OWEFU|nr:unnamed protein product [Owenia fusiformis]
MAMWAISLAILTVTSLLRQTASSAYKTCQFKGFTLESCRYYVDGQYVDIAATINTCVQPNDVKVNIAMASQATWTHTFVNKNEMKEVPGFAHQVSLQLFLNHDVIGQLKIEAKFIVDSAPLFPFITDTVAIPTSPNCFTPLGGTIGLVILIIFIILVIMIIVSIVCFVIIRRRRCYNPEHLITNEQSDPKDIQDDSYTTTVISNDTLALPKIQIELVSEQNEETKDMDIYKGEVNTDKELNRNEQPHAQKGDIVPEKEDMSVPSKGKFHGTNGNFHDNDASGEFRDPYGKCPNTNGIFHGSNGKFHNNDTNGKFHYNQNSKESCQENGAVGGMPNTPKKKHRSKRKNVPQSPKHHKTSHNKQFMKAGPSIESIKEDDAEIEGIKTVEVCT